MLSVIMLIVTYKFFMLSVVTPLPLALSIMTVSIMTLSIPDHKYEQNVYQTLVDKKTYIFFDVRCFKT